MAVGWSMVKVVKNILIYFLCLLRYQLVITTLTF